MMQRTPPAVKPYVTAFCDEVLPDATPVYVPVQPAPHQPVNQCFTVVPKHVLRHGGTQVIGWRIREWPDVLIEAEYHSIWRSPQGKLIDINPNDLTDGTRILFLEDLNGKRQPLLIDNIRKPLMHSDDVQEFCRLAAELTRERNHTYKPENDESVITPRMVETARRMEQLAEAIERKLRHRRRPRRSR